MPTEYKIKTLNDILSIPEDRQNVFFAELIPHIRQITKARSAMKSMLLDDANLDDMIQLGTMTWIDDGKKDISVEMNFMFGSDDDVSK